MKLAYVDTCVWIARIEGLSNYRVIIEKELNRLLQEGWTFCLSDAVRLEALARPSMQHQDDLIQIYHQLFSAMRDLKGYAGVLKEALVVSHAEGLKAMDAIHVTIAQYYGCQRFISTDLDFRRLKLITPYWIRLNV